MKKTPRDLAIRILHAKKMSSKLKCPYKTDKNGYGQDHWLTEMALLHVELRETRLR